MRAGAASTPPGTILRCLTARCPSCCASAHRQALLDCPSDRSEGRLRRRRADPPVEIGANEEKRMVRWLSRRLSFPLRAPNLNHVGFALVGGRPVAGNEKPGAMFIYENADKQRIRFWSAGTASRRERRRFAMRTKRASAFSTGSMTPAVMHCRANSAGRSSCPSRESCTGNLPRSTPRRRTSQPGQQPCACVGGASSGRLSPVRALHEGVSSRGCHSRGLCTAGH